MTRSQTLLFQVKKCTANKKKINKPIILGFKKCGIYPFTPSVVIDRLPSKTPQTANREIKKRTIASVSETVIEMLSTMRYGDKSAKTAIKRKKLNIEPGKSITLDTISSSELSSKLAKSTRIKKGNTKPKHHCRSSDISELDDSDDIPYADTSIEDELKVSDSDE